MHPTAPPILHTDAPPPTHGLCPHGGRGWEGAVREGGPGTGDDPTDARGAATRCRPIAEQERERPVRGAGGRHNGRQEDMGTGPPVPPHPPHPRRGGVPGRGGRGARVVHGAQRGEDRGGDGGALWGGRGPADRLRHDQVGLSPTQDLRCAPGEQDWREEWRLSQKRNGRHKSMTFRMTNTNNTFIMHTCF